MRKKSKKIKFNLKRIRKFINSNPVYILIAAFVVMGLLYGANEMIMRGIKNKEDDYSKTKYELKTIKIGGREISINSSTNYSFYTDESVSIKDITLGYEGYINHRIQNQNYVSDEDLVFEQGDQVHIDLYRYDEKVDSYIIDIQAFIEPDKWSDRCPLSFLGQLKEKEEEYCSKNLRINSKNYILEADFTGNQVNYGEGSRDYEFEIKLNNILIYRGYLGSLFYLEEYYLMGDAIFFTAHEGTDIAQNYIIGVLPESRVFLNLEHPDKELEHVYIYTYENPIVVEGKNIRFLATRLTHGELIEGMGETRICDVNPNTIVSATYSFDYLGKGKISEISRTNIVTAGQEIITLLEDRGYDACPN
jgi:archaellum component FlaF (FlaF/FlaG flagellin family)